MEAFGVAAPPVTRSYAGHADSDLRAVGGPPPTAPVIGSYARRADSDRRACGAPVIGPTQIGMQRTTSSCPRARVARVPSGHSFAWIPAAGGRPWVQPKRALTGRRRAWPPP